MTNQALSTHDRITFEFSSYRSNGQVAVVEGRWTGDTNHGRNREAALAEAAAIASMFPKALKVKASTLSCADGDYAYVKFTADLRADNVNGGRNETGIRRYRQLRSKLAELNIDSVFVDSRPATHVTELELEEAIA